MITWSVGYEYVYNGPSPAGANKLKIIDQSSKLGQNKVNRVEKLEKLFFCLEERHLLLL